MSASPDVPAVASMANLELESKSKDQQDEVQIFFVFRHGDRLDNHDRKWRKKNPDKHEDTPLSPLGFTQAKECAVALADSTANIRHILASPFLRTIQTAIPTSLALKIPIKLESSVWETGCRKPPPSHKNEGHPIDETSGYESCFTPKCGEHRPDFRPRLARAAALLSERFPVGSGDVAIFSHADPVAYLVTELCGIDPGVTGPITPCCMYRLERRRGDKLFRVVGGNPSINHLSEFGNTEPCHPIHSFHDWCRLFENMRNSGVVKGSFRWPPLKDQMPALKKAWHARYMSLLETGVIENEHGKPSKQEGKKVRFSCPKCDAVSFVSHHLYWNGPRTHRVNCWNCKKHFYLSTIIKD